MEKGRPPWTGERASAYCFRHLAPEREPAIRDKRGAYERMRGLDHVKLNQVRHACWRRTLDTLRSATGSIGSSR